MPVWLRRILQFLGLLSPDVEPPFTRTREMAAAMRVNSLDLIETNETGTISCPWHMERSTSCEFDRARNLFRCGGCSRTGSLDTLERRLRAPGVYERAVE